MPVCTTLQALEVQLPIYTGLLFLKIGIITNQTVYYPYRGYPPCRHKVVQKPTIKQREKSLSTTKTIQQKPHNSFALQKTLYKPRQLGFQSMLNLEPTEKMCLGAKWGLT